MFFILINFIELGKREVYNKFKDFLSFCKFEKILIISVCYIF